MVLLKNIMSWNSPRQVGLWDPPLARAAELPCHMKASFVDALSDELILLLQHFHCGLKLD